VLARVRAVNDTFPPLAVDGGWPVGSVELVNRYTQWLSAEQPEHRWVATMHGLPVGHVQLGRLHEYLVPVLSGLDSAGKSWVELSRLFVAPEVLGSGVARRLVGQVVSSVDLRVEALVLDVLAANEPARRLYQSCGWVQVAEFVGVEGVNCVYRYCGDVQG
jgi:GNAT superfamily N-acetyltransferase